MPRDNARLKSYHMQHLLPGLTALRTVNLINNILGELVGFPGTKSSLHMHLLC